MDIRERLSRRAANAVLPVVNEQAIPVTPGRRQGERYGRLLRQRGSGFRASPRPRQGVLPVTDWWWKGNGRRPRAYPSKRDVVATANGPAEVRHKNCVEPRPTPALVIRATVCGGGPRQR